MAAHEIETAINAAINANLATQVAAVETARGVTLDDTFTLYDYRAEIFKEQTLPGVGVRIVRLLAGRVRVGRIDYSAQVVIDYLFRGTKRSSVKDQVYFMHDAMIRVMGGLREHDEAQGANAQGIMGAAEAEFDTDFFHDLGELMEERALLGAAGPIIGGFRMIVPVRQRDEI